MTLERTAHHDALGICVNGVDNVHIRGIQPHIDCTKVLNLERTSHHDALGIRVNDVNKVYIRRIQLHIYRTEVLKFGTNLPS